MKKKTYVLIVSIKFPSTHKRAGEPTNFDYNILDGVKIHTIRENVELWKKRIEEINQGKAILSIRYWSGAPFRSKQIELKQLTYVGYQELESMDLEDGTAYTRIRNLIFLDNLAKNDGLSLEDFKEWFKNYDLKPKIIIHFTEFRY